MNLNLHVTSNVAFDHFVATHAFSLLKKQSSVAFWAWHALSSNVITLGGAEACRLHLIVAVELKYHAVV
jgi:hypothetical protein